MEGNGKPASWWLPRYEHFAVGALIAFVLGNVAQYALPGSLLADWRSIACLILIAMGLVIASQVRWVIRASLLWLCFLTGALWFSLHVQMDSHDIAKVAPLHDAQVEGVIVDHPAGNVHRAFVDVLRVNGAGYTGKILTTTSAGLKLPSVGTTVLLQGDLGLPRVPVVPGEFNERNYLQAENVTAVLRRVDVMRVTQGDPVAWQAKALRFLNDTQNRMAGIFTAVLPSPEAEVVGGIVLGGRAIPVDKETKRQFVETGLVHVLAASGMNVGIVAGFVYGLLAILKVPMGIRLMVAMVAVAFYAVLTGMPPSIQRAATMLELALFLKLLKKELSPLFLLCFAAALLVALDPGLVGSLGFQFSVLTTFGLITMVPPLQEWLGRYITRVLAGVILVPVVAQLWVTPLTLYHFNQLPLHSVGLNILALFFVIPLTSIGFTAGALSLLWAPLGQAVVWLAWPFVKGLLWVVQVGDAMGWAKASLPSPEPWLLALMYALLAWCVWSAYDFRQWSKRRKVLVAASLIVMMVVPLALRKIARMNAVEVAVVPLSYQQAAFVVRQAQAVQPLVLMPANAGYYEGRRLSDFLRHENIRQLTALVTYGEPTDESGTGLKTVLKQLKSSPREFHFSKMQGGHLTLGELTLRQTDNLFEIRKGAFCLAGTQEKAPSDCHLVYQPSGKGYRLSPARFLEPERFYRLNYVPDGRLAVISAY